MIIHPITRFIIGMFLVFSGLSISIPGQAIESFRYGLSKNNQIFTNKKSALAGSNFDLQIKGGIPATIKLDLVDIYADDFGAKQLLPLNSNPFSAVGLVEYPEIVGRYIPSSEFQTIRIPFKFKDLTDVNKPILGGLRISIVTDNESNSNVKVVSSIVATFAYYPVKAKTKLKKAVKPKLNLPSPKIVPAQDFFPFNLIPNLPRVYNQSPIQAEITVKNVGNIFLNTKTQLVVVDPRFFDSGSDAELLKSYPQELMLVPNQIGSFKLDLTKSDPTSQEVADVFPGIGIYRAITTSTGSLGSNELTVQTNEQLIIVFPWKYTLVGLILLYLILWQFRSRFKLVAANSDSARNKSYLDSNELDSFNSEFERIMAKHREQKNSDS